MVNIKKEQKNTSSIICTHCHKKIMTVNLIGLSLICPLCGKPGNGLPHTITK